MMVNTHEQKAFVPGEAYRQEIEKRVNLHRWDIGLVGLSIIFLAVSVTTVNVSSWPMDVKNALLGTTWMLNLSAIGVGLIEAKFNESMASALEVVLKNDAKNTPEKNYDEIMAL